MSRFINDCVARAVFTLPWASIDDTDITLREIREDIASGAEHRVSAAVAKFAELAEQEVSIHTAAGNYMKAGVIHQFSVSLADHYTPKATRRRRSKP